LAAAEAARLVVELGRDLAAALASLRACLANFFALLRALRAALNRALASRTCFRATSAAFSAATALVAKDRKLRAAIPTAFSFLLVFIGYLIGVNIGRFRSVVPSVTCDNYVTTVKRCKAFIVTFSSRWHASFLNVT
jgi:hypothetical protein